MEIAKQHFTAEPIQASVSIKPERSTKSGRTLKAVFGRWDGSALITDTGRLCPKKEFALITKTKGAQLASKVEEAVARFNDLSIARMALESKLIAEGKRTAFRVYADPKSGRTIIETALANKDAKLIKQMKDAGCTEAQIEAVLAKRG